MAEKTFDLRGLKCPLPVLRTRRALASMAPGDVLIVSCTDPLAGIDIPNLLRQTRPMKPDEGAAASPGGEPSTAPVRPLGRPAIDSTGARTAQMKATLTVVLGRLEPGSDPAVNQPTQRSAASDLLRVLDAYAADPVRLSA